jgi:hypothetical protein
MCVWLIGEGHALWADGGLALKPDRHAPMQAAAKDKRKQRDHALSLRIKEAYLSDEESGLVSLARACLRSVASDGARPAAQPIRSLRRDGSCALAERIKPAPRRPAPSARR